MASSVWVILRTRCSASHNVVRSHFCAKGKGLQVVRRWAKGSPGDEARAWGDGAWNLPRAPPVTLQLLHAEEGWKTDSSRPTLPGCSRLLPSAQLSGISPLLYFQFLWISFYTRCYSDLPSHPLPGDGQGCELVHLKMKVLRKSRAGGDGLKQGDSVGDRTVKPGWCPEAREQGRGGQESAGQAQPPGAQWEGGVVEVETGRLAKILNFRE